MVDSRLHWHSEVLPSEWERAAADLTAQSALSGFYLAGGTGLALHLGHRRSVDLDLFTEANFAVDTVRDSLRGLDGHRNLELRPGTAHFELHGIKISLLHYAYPLLFPTMEFSPLAVADPRDIACMKLDTVSSRGSRRDFVDLYMAARKYGLRDILQWFEAKYAGVSYNRTHLFKSLTYFEDAEQEPMPDMLIALEWSTVRDYFLVEAPRMARLG